MQTRWIITQASNPSVNSRNRIQYLNAIIHEYENKKDMLKKKILVKNLNNYIKKSPSISNQKESNINTNI